MGGEREGREGDWECSGCNNRNYAFRSFCNRCKQPRLLVDTITPPDSKWLPRIGDWICTGCTNNNYASREKCKKCSQPKEVAAMPAVAIPGALPAYSHHYSMGQAGPELRMSFASAGHVAHQHHPPLPPGSNWSTVGTDRIGFHASSTIQLGGNHTSGNLSTNQLLSAPKGWRNGDWICSCGFHNYSSRAQCKKCNASAPPALGTKRLASEEFAQYSENKRINSGQMGCNLLANGQQLYTGFDQIVGNGASTRAGMYAPSPSVSSMVTPNPNLPLPHLQIPTQFPNPVMTPALFGKGAKQWRSGDWMCSSCNNHNYASRAQCNRCKSPREAVNQPVNVA